MDINQRLTEELDVKRWQIDAAVQLIDEGNTIPFISRYRKEATGELNDEQLRKLYERLVYLKNLEEKKEQVISSIEEQGKLKDDITLSSDIIVGFPGETDEDFEQTLKLVPDTRFDLLFTFLYSPRTGTPAASYEDNATPQDKQRRFERLYATISSTE